MRDPEVSSKLQSPPPLLSVSTFILNETLGRSTFKTENSLHLVTLEHIQPVGRWGGWLPASESPECKEERLEGGWGHSCPAGGRMPPARRPEKLRDGSYLSKKFTVWTTKGISLSDPSDCAGG